MGARQTRTPDASLAELVVFRRYLERACKQADGQRALGRVIGVTQAAISKTLKGGGGVSGATIDAVARYLGLSRDVILGRVVEVHTVVSDDPKLAAAIEFAHRTMGLSPELIVQVVDRLVQAKIKIDLVLLLDAFLWEKKIMDAGGLPGRPIVR